MSAINQEGNAIILLLRRFLFLYLIFYIYPYGFEYIYEFDTNTISPWEGMTKWFGRTFFGWEYGEELYKGFDSYYDFARFGLIAALSVIGAVLWRLIDRFLRRNYEALLTALTRTIIRYHVAFTLVLYGMCKVFPLQFGEMDLDSLNDTFGEQTPMGLLWTFMSYSTFYSGVTGWIEVIGAVLLLFRRTSFLGAVISFVAMANVVLIDIGYDVTVKMFATHLFLMVIVLLLPDLKRILNFFVFNKEVLPNDHPYLFNGTKRFQLLGWGLKSALLLVFTVATYFYIGKRIDQQLDRSNDHIRGYYEVEQMMVNGDTLQDEPNTWKAITISGSSYRSDRLRVKFEDGQSKTFRFEADSAAKTLNFHVTGVKTDKYEMNYRYEKGDRVSFEGMHLGDTIRLRTKLKRIDDFRLTQEPVHWVRDWQF